MSIKCRQCGNTEKVEELGVNFKDINFGEVDVYCGNCGVVTRNRYQVTSFSNIGIDEVKDTYPDANLADKIKAFEATRRGGETEVKTAENVNADTNKTVTTGGAEVGNQPQNETKSNKEVKSPTK